MAAFIPKNYPVFPVAPYPGDNQHPPVKGNTGIGIREMSAMIILHALLSNPKYFVDPSQAVPDAFDIADEFYEEIFR
jgi:hypothetical protein